jgi:HSP20 family protein
MLIWRRPPLLSGLFEDPDPGLELDWRPDLDVFELADEFVLSLSLPGVRARDVDITVVGPTISISGVRDGSAPPGAVPHLIESSHGRFRRRVRLPPEARLSGIRTRMAEGQLVVRVPKISRRATRLSIRRGR